MPNSLYPSGSLDQLPHFASPMKESAVISSVMVVLYPFLLHTVKCFRTISGRKYRSPAAH